MAFLIKKESDKWFLDDSKLKKQLKIHNINFFDYISVEKYVSKSIFNDFRFKLFVIDEIKNKGYFYYELFYFPEINNEPYIITLDNNSIRDWLPNKNKLDILGESIDYYMSSKYILNTFLSKKITGYDFTYKNLIDLLSTPTETFIKKINNNNFFGTTGINLIEILSNKPFDIINLYRNDSIFNYIDISDGEKQQIHQNFHILSYLYTPDLIAKQEFIPNEDLVNNFELNYELEETILNEIPNIFTDLQKAYYIYKRLCQKFSYDEEYYYLLSYGRESKVALKHQDFDRLEKLKGGDDVICTEFSLIFAKFLKKLNIPFQLLGYKNQMVDKIDSKHIKVRFKTGDYVVDADAAHLITKSDMVFEKIYGQTNFFTVVNEHKRTQDFFVKELKEVDDYFANNKELMEYSDAKELYEKLYVDSKKKLSFNDKIKLIFDIIESQNLKFIDMLSFINTIQKNIFYEEGDKFQIEFFVDNSENHSKLNILVCYNENKNKLTEHIKENCYIIVTPDKEKKQISYDIIKENFEKGIYDFTTLGRNLLDLKGDYYEQGSNSKRNK